MKRILAIYLIITLTIMTFFVPIDFITMEEEKIEAAVPVIAGGLRLVGGVAVRSGVKTTTKRATKSFTKHSIHRLSKDGKVVAPQQWVKNAKKAPTTTSHGGKFLKYTLNTASVLSLATLMGDVAQDTLRFENVNEDGNYVFNYTDYYDPTIHIGDPSNPNLSSKVVTEFDAFRYDNYTIQVNYLNLESGQFDTKRLTKGYWLRASNPLYLMDIQPNPNDIYKTNFYFNMIDHNNVLNHLVYEMPIVPTHFFREFHELTVGEPYHFFENIPSTEIQYQPTENIVPDPTIEEVEIYIPRNPDALEQIIANPDIIFNPNPDLVPEGDPTIRTDDAGDPVLNEDGSPLPEPPAPEVLPPPTGLPNEGKTCGRFELDDLESATLFTTKFPFSIPWDVYNAINALFGGMGSNPPNLKWILYNHEIDIKIPDFINNARPFMHGVIIFIFDISIIYALRKWWGGAS